MLKLVVIALDIHIYPCIVNHHSGYTSMKMDTIYSSEKLISMWNENCHVPADSNI
jgi:hypothetical protein